MANEISEASEETLVEVADSQEEATEEEASVTEGDPPEEQEEEAAEEGDEEGKELSKNQFHYRCWNLAVTMEGVHQEAV